MGTGKLLIFSAPSGSGKTSIVRHLQKTFPKCIDFSVSATSRSMRGEEVNGKDYHFLSGEEFRTRLDRGEFLEWQEVYPGTYYGTLRTEVEKIWSRGMAVIFDIDVEGGINLKKQFGRDALSVFVMPPSIQALEERLRSRKTDPEESIKKRVAKAERELKTADQFDIVLPNINLDQACRQAEVLVTDFLGRK